MRASITTLLTGGGNGGLTIQTTGSMTKHLRSKKVSNLIMYMVENSQLAVALVVNRPIISSPVVVSLELVIYKGISIMDLNIPKIIVGEHMENILLWVW